MKTKKVPMRRCIGCMESKPKNQMIRVAYFENNITVDPSGKAKGRGVYLCLDESCIAKAQKKKALQRNFGGDIAPNEIDRVFEELINHEQEDN